MIQLSIIIVNYKSIPLVLDCMRTIYDQTKNTAFEVIVVSNDTDAAGEQILAEKFPGTKWIDMKYNAGFARANNEGIRQSKGDTVLLLNPDTLIEAFAIDRSYFEFTNSPYVACGVQLLNPDRTPQISGNYFMKGGLNYLLPLPYTGNILRSIAFSLKVDKPNIPDAKGVVEADWINGAYLMVKKAIIAKAGLLDEDFFLYAEEAEWCARLRKYGEICVFGDAHVIHLQGETANETFGSAEKGYFNLFDRKGKQIMLSNLVRIRKQFGIGWFLFILGFYTMEIPIFFLGLLIEKTFKGKKAVYNFAQCKGYCINMGTVLGKTITILKNKPYFYKVL